MSAHVANSLQWDQTIKNENCFTIIQHMVRVPGKRVLGLTLKFEVQQGHWKTILWLISDCYNYLMPTMQPCPHGFILERFLTHTLWLLAAKKAAFVYSDMRVYLYGKENTDDSVFLWRRQEFGRQPIGNWETCSHYFSYMWVVAFNSHWTPFLF